jgi:hypothetical protein
MLTLTATQLPRVMQCNGSLIMPVIESESVSATRAEGDAAHWLIQQVHSGKATADELVEKKAPNGVFITDDMVENVTPYLAAIGRDGKTEVSSQITDGKTWEVNSRADHKAQRADVMYIDEFKYGWTIVEAEMNWTLLAHAFAHFNSDYNVAQPKTYVFTVYQPRPYHPKGKVRSWTISKETLLVYYNQLSRTLFKPSETLNTGNECRNCPSRATCPAALKALMNSIDVSETVYEATIDNDSLSALMDTMKRAEDVIEQTKKAYTELAKYRIKQGQIVRNYQLENDLTNRNWKPDTKPELLQAMTGIDVQKKVIVTPSQAEKLGVSPDFINLFTHREIKGTKLTRVDENTKAEKLFNKPKGN